MKNRQFWFLLIISQSENCKGSLTDSNLVHIAIWKEESQVLGFASTTTVLCRCSSCCCGAASCGAAARVPATLRHCSPRCCGATSCDCGAAAHNNAATRSVAVLRRCSLCCCGAARVAAALHGLLQRGGSSWCCKRRHYGAAAARGAATLGFGLRLCSNIKFRWS